MPLLINGNGAIVGGFHGRSQELIDLQEKLFTKLLGRGGSDTTATFLAYMLSQFPHLFVHSVRLFKAGPIGIMTTDHRIEEKARVIHELPYDIAELISRLGARVLHSKATEWARRINIPIYCLNLRTRTGTIISGESENPQIILTLLKNNSGYVIGIIGLNAINLFQLKENIEKGLHDTMNIEGKFPYTINPPEQHYTTILLPNNEKIAHQSLRSIHNTIYH